MTIHSDFFKIIKDGCGHAFTDSPPLAPDVVFIDGQVKLMKADAITTWELFYSVQFFRTVEKCFALGAHTVVLAFDDYDHVPSSKAMTQAKRAKQRVNYDFAQTSALPSRPPEDWGSAMANRTFKVRVVARVLDVTRAWFELKLKTDPQFAGRTLVLDYRGEPAVVHAPGAARGDSVQQYVASRNWGREPGCIGRGECDIKAYSWLPLARCLCIVSVDGDYLPLSLLQGHAQAGVDQGVDGLAEAREILLFRLTTQTAPAGGKRKSAGEDAESRGRRQYEFVRVGAVAAWLHVVFPSKAADPLQQFCAMVALCGCDFARNLPRLGARTLWKMRHRMQNADLSHPAQALCAVACAYHDMFVARNAVPPRVTNSVEWFGQASDELALSVYEELFSRVTRDQKVAETIRKQLWTAAASHVHSRNTRWTLQYWSLLERAPDPLSANFGYVRDSRGRTGFA